MTVTRDVFLSRENPGVEIDSLILSKRTTTVEMIWAGIVEDEHTDLYVFYRASHRKTPRPEEVNPIEHLWYMLDAQLQLDDQCVGERVVAVARGGRKGSW
ncbi:hypothetical protein TNCV_3273631 [Trichonephila clavipes]|nr:hypothetical protein TNCV_3273631 [Trichonephila clavipes]